MNKIIGLFMFAMFYFVKQIVSICVYMCEYYIPLVTGYSWYKCKFPVLTMELTFFECR